MTEKLNSLFFNQLKKSIYFWLYCIERVGVLSSLIGEQMQMYFEWNYYFGGRGNLMSQWTHSTILFIQRLKEQHKTFE